MFCCACAGSCNHVGNHSFCEAHGGTYTLAPAVRTTSNISYSSSAMDWQDETLDSPGWLRRPLRVLIAAVDAWRGRRRDWRAGASW